MHEVDEAIEQVGLEVHSAMSEEYVEEVDLSHFTVFQLSVYPLLTEYLYLSFTVWRFADGAPCDVVHGSRL